MIHDVVAELARQARRVMEEASVSKAAEDAPPMQSPFVSVLHKLSAERGRSQARPRSRVESSMRCFSCCEALYGCQKPHRSHVDLNGPKATSGGPTRLSWSVSSAQ